MTFLPPLWTTALRWMGPLATALAVTASEAAEPPPGLAASEDGNSVRDLGTQQIWPRCVAGMQWNGKTCTGEPLRMTREEAGAWAQAMAKAEGLPWRLPRVTELRQLVGKSTRHADPALFPAAPDGWHWSVSANINTAQVNPYDYANIAQGRTNENIHRLALRQSWAVHMATGEARGDVDKSTRLPVRLVRTQP